MDELGLEINCDYDLNDIECRLYSQIFHGVANSEENVSIFNDNEKDTSLNVCGNKHFCRYFESRTQQPVSVHITVNRNSEVYCVDNFTQNSGCQSNNHDNLVNLTSSNADCNSKFIANSNITAKQNILPVISNSIEISKFPIIENLHKHNFKRITTQSQNVHITNLELINLQKFGGKKSRRKYKKLSKRANKKIIFISDESDNDSIALNRKEKNEATFSKNSNDCLEKVSVYSSDDDVIYIPPPPVNVINLDEEEIQTVAKNIELRNECSVQQNEEIPQGRPKIVAKLLESTLNDFLDRSVVKSTPSTFNFALHGSDFNSAIECADTNTIVDFCETESSCSTNEPNKDFNNSAKMAFDEVEFPIDSIFADKNLDNFSSFITPNRISKNVEKHLSDSKCNVDTDSSTSSTESDYEPVSNEVGKNIYSNDLPTLSSMVNSKCSEGLNKDLRVNDIEKNSVSSCYKKSDVPKSSISSLRKNFESDGHSHNLEALETTDSLKKTLLEFMKKKKRQKNKLTTHDCFSEKQEIIDNSPNNKFYENIVEEEKLTKNKRKTAKKNTFVNNENKIKGIHFENKVLEREMERLESPKLEQEVNKKIVENNILNVLQDPSDINLFNNTFFDEMGDLNDMQETEDNDIIILEPINTSNSEDVIVLNDKSDSELELVERSETDQMVSFNLSGLKLAHCRIIFPSPVDSSEFFSDFDLKLIQSKQSDDPQKWSISYKDKSANVVLRKKGPRCNRCRHFGHIGSKCPDKPHPPCCSLCGDAKHQEPRCPNKICRQCGNLGDYSTTYCHLCFKYRHIECNLCNVPGHLSKFCPDLWRRYHLTTQEGPIIKPKEQVMRPRNQQWCSGCAQQGHLEHECNDIYYHREFPPTRPDIVNYVDIQSGYGITRNIPCISQIFEQPVSDYSPIHNIPSLLDINTNPYLHIPNTMNSNINMKTSNLKNNCNIQHNDLLPELVHQMEANYQCIDMNHRDSDIILQNNLVLPLNANNISDPSKFDMTKIHELFMSLPQTDVKCFLRKQVDELDTKIINYDLKVLRNKLFKYDRISENVSEKVKKDRLFWFRILNMFIFGLHTLNDGKLHMRYIRNFIAGQKSIDFDKSKRRSLFNSYAYIFGVDKHKNVSYYRLIKLLMDKSNRSRSIRNQKAIY